MNSKSLDIPFKLIELDFRYSKYDYKNQLITKKILTKSQFKLDKTTIKLKLDSNINKRKGKLPLINKSSSLPNINYTIRNKSNIISSKFECSNMNRTGFIGNGFKEYYFKNNIFLEPISNRFKNIK